MTKSVIAPPVARKEPTSTTLHGQTLEDNYSWMRDKTSPEVIAYLTAENDYTSAEMKPTERCRLSSTPRCSRTSRRPTYRFPTATTAGTTTLAP